MSFISAVTSPSFSPPILRLTLKVRCLTASATVSHAFTLCTHTASLTAWTMKCVSQATTSVGTCDIRMTIIEAIKEAMRINGGPMTIREVYEAITGAGLYTFHAEKPAHVGATLIRRH